MSKIILLLSLATLALSLPEGFHRLNQQYIISAATANYLSAFTTCKRYGYELATEKTAEETAAVNEAIASSKIANVPAYSYWLGAIYEVDSEFQPEWIWIDDGQVMSYSNWQTTSGTACLLKNPLKTYNGTWKDSLCTSAQYFICQNS